MTTLLPCHIAMGRQVGGTVGASKRRGMQAGNATHQGCVCERVNQPQGPIHVVLADLLWAHALTAAAKLETGENGFHRSVVQVVAVVHRWLKRLREYARSVKARKSAGRSANIDAAGGDWFWWHLGAPHLSKAVCSALELVVTPPLSPMRSSVAEVMRYETRGQPSFGSSGYWPSSRSKELLRTAKTKRSRSSASATRSRSSFCGFQRHVSTCPRGNASRAACLSCGPDLGASVRTPPRTRTVWARTRRPRRTQWPRYGATRALGRGRTWPASQQKRWRPGGSILMPRNLGPTTSPAMSQCSSVPCGTPMHSMTPPSCSLRRASSASMSWREISSRFPMQARPNCRACGRA
jgi:hypothetical protein